MAKTVVREDEQGLFVLFSRGIYRPWPSTALPASTSVAPSIVSLFRKGEVVSIHGRVKDQWCLAKSPQHLSGERWYFHCFRSASVQRAARLDFDQSQDIAA